MAGRFPGDAPEISDGPGPLYGDMRYPGRGHLPRPGEDRPMLSAWGRLSRNGGMGKKANLPFDATGGQIQKSPVQIFRVQGDDADAQQVVVTLGPPRIVALAFSSALANNCQNITAEQDNAEIQSRGSFPGTVDPVRWPPVEAILEWGVGGSSYRAYFDFINGASASVVASFVELKAAIVSGSDIDISGTSAVYTLSAFVGPGVARDRAQRTVYVGQVASQAESAVFAVPPFARLAYVVGCDPTAPPATAVTVATLRFWQSPDATNCVGNFVVAGNQPLPFVVPAGAAYATVVNGMGVASRMSIVYSLSI